MLLGSVCHVESFLIIFAGVCEGRMLDDMIVHLDLGACFTVLSLACGERDQACSLQLELSWGI